MSLDPGWFMSPVTLLVALAIDRWWGEPRLRLRLHPMVWMGNYLTWGGQKAQKMAAQDTAFTHRRPIDAKTDYKAFWLAALIWCVGAAIVVVAAVALQRGVLALVGAAGSLVASPGQSLGSTAGGLLAATLMGCLLKPMLAWAMLRGEVLAVEHALNPAHGGSLAAGRERLRWLVSREVSNLTEAQVRESAIESLAENLNDSVVAPIFWFVLLGLPGAALYRFANTADAMWGYPGVYKDHNWQWAGKWAARVDDGLSYIPARITGVMLAAVSRRANWRNLRKQAALTPSPNSGWPMAAMALALGVGLQKPGVYALNPQGRQVTASDMPKAIVYSSKVVLALLSIALSAIILIAFMPS